MPLQGRRDIKKANEEEYDDMPDEIDFSGAFPSAEAVNEAQRLLKRASREGTAAGKRHDRARSS
jgi:hypothetical protein